MRSDPTFSAQVEVRNRVVNVALSGELDMATVPIMEQQLGPYEQDGAAALMLDLRHLTFLDSSAVHAFVAANDRARSSGKQFVLIGADDAARRLLQLTQTQHLLDDERSALLLERFLGGQASDLSGKISEPSDG